MSRRTPKTWMPAGVLMRIRKGEPVKQVQVLGAIQLCARFINAFENGDDSDYCISNEQMRALYADDALTLSRYLVQRYRAQAPA